MLETKWEKAQGTRTWGSHRHARVSSRLFEDYVLELKGSHNVDFRAIDTIGVLLMNLSAVDGESWAEVTIKATRHISSHTMSTLGIQLL